jgi:hypothetical protein
MGMKRSPSIFVVSVFLMISAMFIWRCKGHLVEGDNLAKYTFSNLAGVCSGHIITGQYTTGDALAVNNKITLQVNVSRAGQYNITTSSINGMQFSGSGEFTSTGMQTVVLQGSGKPLAKGNFTYNTPGTSGCTFIIPVSEKPVDYAVYTVAESLGVCQEPVLSGRFIRGLAMSDVNTLKFSVHVVALGAFSISTNTVNGISFSTSGTYTKTGDQAVSLNAFGTPNDPGTFYYTLSAGNGTCSFHLAIQNP